MFVFSCHVAWSAFSSGSAAAGNGFCLHDVATLYQAEQWLKTKCKTVPSQLSRTSLSSPQSWGILRRTAGFCRRPIKIMIFRCRVLKSGWLQLHHAHRPIQQWCLSSQSNEVSNVGWSSLYKKCLEFRHCLLFNCTAVTANIYTIAMSCPGMISCIICE